MSASKQKRLRSVSEVPDKKTVAEQEKAMKDRKFRRNAVIFICVFAVIIIAALIINSSLLYTALPAVEVNGTDYSAVELSFFFTTAYNQFYVTYGADLVGAMIDPSVPLSEQTCMLDAEGGTWSDYFLDQALMILEESDSLYKEAVANGYAVDDEIRETAEANLAYAEIMASSSGYDTDTYLAMSYCKGMTSERYLEISEKYLLSSKYAEEAYNGFEYTDEELDAYYAENADSYDSFTYNVFLVSASEENYPDLGSDEERLAAAVSDAERIAGAASTQEFNELAAEFSGNESEDTETTSEGRSLAGVYSEWMLDPERVGGDTYVAETETGAYAVRFISREGCEYHTVDVRHILIEAAPNDEGVITEEALEIAKAEAEDIKAQWESDPTEEKFIELANAYSDDTGSVGGLYEQVFRGQMVEDFDAFCFGNRIPGDTSDIIYGTNGQYEGYHFIYFVGENDLYSHVIADSVLRQEDYTAFVESATEGVTAELKWASRFAGLG